MPRALRGKSLQTGYLDQGCCSGARDSPRCAAKRDPAVARRWLPPCALTASDTGAGVQQGAPGLRGVNPRGAARDVDGSSIKSEARPPPLSPSPPRRAPLPGAPRPRAQVPPPWRALTGRTGSASPGAPAACAPGAGMDPERCAPFGVGPGPGPYPAAGDEPPSPHGTPAGAPHLHPAPPRGPRPTRFPACGPLEPYLPEPAKPPAKYLQDLGPGPALNGSHFYEGPAEGNARRGRSAQPRPALLPFPGPPGPLCPSPARPALNFFDPLARRRRGCLRSPAGAGPGRAKAAGPLKPPVAGRGGGGRSRVELRRSPPPHPGPVGPEGDPRREGETPLGRSWPGTATDPEAGTGHGAWAAH